jgi:hypothetical protein
MYYFGKKIFPYSFQNINSRIHFTFFYYHEFRNTNSQSLIQFRQVGYKAVINDNIRPIFPSRRTIGYLIA